MSRRIRLPARRPGGVLAVSAVLVAMSGVAIAAIPDAAGVIHSCYVPGGALRPVEAPDECDDKAGEKPLSWNQQGPSGTDGAPGPQGPAGPPGPVGESGARVYQRYFDGHVGDRSYVNVSEPDSRELTIPLEPGAYSLVGVGRLYSWGDSNRGRVRDTTITCILRAGTQSDVSQRDGFVISSLGQTEEEFVTTLATNLETGSLASFTCRPSDRAGKGWMGIRSMRLVATKVGSVSSVPIPLRPGERRSREMSSSQQMRAIERDLKRLIKRVK